MSESTFWSDQLRPLILSLDPQRIECKVDTGIPDVNYIGGWIENKVVDYSADVKPSVVPKIPHFTPVQRLWLDRRWHAGGLAWLMLRTRGEWFLLDGRTAQVINTEPFYGLRMRAALHSVKTPRSDELCAWLMGVPLSRGGQLRMARLRRCLDSFEVDRALGFDLGRTADAETGKVPLTDDLEEEIRSALT